MSDALTVLIEQEILNRLSAKTSFTALDVSNALKANRYPVRHSQAAEIVRDIFQSGAMAHYDFERELIPVATPNGEERAFLYHHTESKSRAYQTRALAALPPPQDARDIADSVALAPVLVRPPRTRRSHEPRRQDGALAIPRDLLQRLGCAAGDLLTLIAEPGRLTVKRATSDMEAAARVWQGPRLRLCKTKLSLGLLSAEFAFVVLDGDGLRVEEQTKNAPA